MGSRSRRQLQRWCPQPLTPLMEGPDFGMEDHDCNKKETSWEVIREWFKIHRTVPVDNSFSSSMPSSLYGPNSSSPAKMQDLRLLLGVLGCPLGPIPISDKPISHLHIKDIPLVSKFCSFFFGSGIFTNSFFLCFALFLTGDVYSLLYNSAVLGGGRMLKAAELGEEHVHIGDGEIGAVRNGDLDGEKREDDGFEERGERLLRSVADVAWNVVSRALRRRPQGGRRQRRQDRVAAHAVAGNSCSQRPTTPSPPHHSGAGSEEHSEPVRESPMPRREEDRRRRLLRPESGGGSRGGDGEERRPRGGDPTRAVRLLQPEERAPHLHGGLPPHQSSLRGKRHRLLGDHDRKQHRGLQGRRRGNDRPPGENGGHRLPIRGNLNAAHEDQNGRNVDDTRSRFQRAGTFG